jgi:hypothetical protein
MSPAELRTFAGQGTGQHEMAERELRRRWDSFTVTPPTPFRSILDD